MRPITLSPKSRTIVRGLTLSAVAVLTVGGIVACQGDQPVAPNRGAVSADTAASRYLYRPGSATLRWQLQDASTWLLLGGGTFQLSGGPSNITLNVTDNVAPELDATTGKFQIVVSCPGRIHCARPSRRPSTCSLARFRVLASQSRSTRTPARRRQRCSTRTF